MKILLFTPAQEDNFGKTSSNLGDLIIEEAVIAQLARLLGAQFELVRISTHSYPPYRSFLRQISQSRYIFVGGSNLLHPPFGRLSKWRLRTLHRLMISRAILLGCGWGRYLELTPTRIDQLKLQLTLSRRLIHSVRDSYTLDKLMPYLEGFSILNTGCPSTWDFELYDYGRLQREKSDVCLLTLTDFAQDVQRDTQLMAIAFANYQHVLFWPQGFGDLQYFMQLLSACPCSDRILVSGLDSVKKFILSLGSNPERRCLGILDHSYEEYKSLLGSTEIKYDYMGTRLHGGIKSLSSYRRTLIIGIDNRAIEMANDIGLPVSAAKSIEQWRAFATGASPYDVKFRLNKAAINSWKSQFIGNKSGAVGGLPGFCRQ